MFRLALLNLFLLSQVTWAGWTSGGGGAYVCQSKEGSLTDALWVDIWEAQNLPYRWPNYGLNTLPIVVDNVQPWQVQLEQAMRKLDAIDSGFAARVREELQYLLSHTYHLPDGIDVVLPPDLDISYFPKGCPPQGVLRFNDQTGMLDMKDNLFALLKTQTDVAAAWVHEAIYKTLRETREHESSLLSRRLTGCLFSSADCYDPEPMENDIKRHTTVYKCTGQAYEYYLMTNTDPKKPADWKVLFSSFGKSKMKIKLWQKAYTKKEGKAGWLGGESYFEMEGGLNGYGYLPIKEFAIQFSIDNKGKLHSAHLNPILFMLKLSLEDSVMWDGSNDSCVMVSQ